MPQLYIRTLFILSYQLWIYPRVRGQSPIYTPLKWVTLNLLIDKRGKTRWLSVVRAPSSSCITNRNSTSLLSIEPKTLYGLQSYSNFIFKYYFFQPTQKFTYTMFKKKTFNIVLIYINYYMKFIHLIERLKNS